MGLASAVNYVATTLNGLAWPQAMQALTSPPPPLACYVQPPNPNVLASVPTAYTWFEMFDESRGSDRYRAGTVPRATYMGGPSGTKTIVHMVPLYIVWMGGSPTDPVANTLFPGMVDAIMAALRVSADPVTVTDPWTGVETVLVDVGETMNGRGYLRDTEPQQLQRLDALVSVQVTEIIAG